MGLQLKLQRGVSMYYVTDCALVIPEELIFSVDFAIIQVKWQFFQ